jgi:penicillin-insensitive murein endopeptidase
VTARFTPGHASLIRAAAEHPDVARIFVNAAIKDHLCRTAPEDDRAWLRVVRPWWGHDAHFHVRLSCPPDSPGCVDQDPPPPGDGCDASLAWWFSDEALNPPKPATRPKPKPPLTLADLPPACADVLSAP